MSYTAKDAAKCGFEVYVVLSATRGIAPESIARELAAMKAAGVHLVDTVEDLPEGLRPKA